jgi:hypothetical protein
LPKSQSELIGEETEWKETFNRLAETAPVQTWPILSALYTAEIEQAMEDTTELYRRELEGKEEQGYRCTNSKVLYAHVVTEELVVTEKNDHYGNDVRAFHLTKRDIIDGLLCLFPPHKFGKRNRTRPISQVRKGGDPRK